MSKTAEHTSRSLSRRSLLTAGGRLLAVGLAAPAIARFRPARAAYPDRPIKLLGPFAPGGPVDVVARLVAQPMADALGGSVVVENRPGASSNLGMGIAARSDPDGYTVLVVASNLVTNPILFAKVPYDVEQDFLPLADLADTPSAFAARKDLGARSLAEMIDLARRSGRFSYAHSGFGTVSHLTAEFLKQQAGLDMAAVSHNGSGPATQSLLSGSVELCVAGLPALHPHIAERSVAGLAITGSQRWFDLPELATMIDQGFSKVPLGNLTAMLVPAKTPPEIADRLSKAAIAALQPPELRAKLRTLGYEVIAGGPEALSQRIAREIPLWRGIAASAGFKPQDPT